ncbi:putative PAS/PAC sensor protein [Denitrovibrio acetiphilus DSM 12809]|uniref:Putative PAS/PAC sensor protein n=1 Tax=Denitrovibrio acetiphilus (strain DSM 12809 / NBRC 114555 / N2460) TaxID=522772 RepID=D4H2F0_DENA2|nr:PAS domain-containing protein [Denitrovibrio acetiphilus]ADD68941.1 putative PAS/PAC sensor protein [Denitrovibrio acetiphilus DSM 12809]
MSEWLAKNDPHMENLRLYCEGILEDEDLGALYREYEDDIKSVRYDEIMMLVDWMVSCEKYDMENIKGALNRIINIFSSQLDRDVFDLCRNVPRFISILAEENTAITAHMESIKEQLQLFSKAEEGTPEFNRYRLSLKKLIEDLAVIDNHYIKKENILFPYVEKYIPEYRCVNVMWSIHDDVRQGMKLLLSLLSETDVDGIRFNRTVGKLFFDIYGLIFREDYILLPVSALKIPEDVFAEMISQCPEIGYSFIEAPEVEIRKSSESSIPDGMVNLDTGLLSAQELVTMLNTLPVDITYVDAEDKVRYFSSPQERIFPRSKAIIGRSVQNCHPPESVHIVNDVVENLKSGKKDVESFWIQMMGKFILIQYFALRDAAGQYIGTIEVSQDITEARSLSGEKRLLDYN